MKNATPSRAAKKARRRKEPTVALTVRITRAACDRLDALAARKGMVTRNPLIQTAIHEFLDREGA